ncbi:macro domain-containing protein [Acinetobacter pittii]|uniref:macro domain-containing protein n=1 Tax=Acinetobacter pittii TaxID=48296 RepID=UPI003978486E
MKVSLFDKSLRDSFLVKVSLLSAVLGLYSIFGNIPVNLKNTAGISFIIFLILIYIFSWLRANYLSNISINIEGSVVDIKSGDLFKQDGYKVIGFNEYFDTIVDNKVISERSLNGIFIKDFLDILPKELDLLIENNVFDDEIIGKNIERISGKETQYKIGTIYVYNDYILTAFSRFDKNNKAYLTMPDYLSFLITFWDKVNLVYAQKNVSVPIFGSGITRIKEHKNISDEELLKIMIWTFRISEMRFKYPAKLSIIIHPEKLNQINLFEIKNSQNGL